MVKDKPTFSELLPQIKEILNKAKTKVLTLDEVKILLKKYKNNDFIKKLIPDPENIKAKDIFSEIGYLSVYGAVPVVGGVAGGIVADSVAKEDLSEKVPDKINEGIYQYLANIFMCNVGAGTDSVRGEPFSSALLQKSAVGRPGHFD